MASLLTPVYRESLDIARSSPDVTSVLGSEITPQWPVIGFDLSSRNSEFAQWSVKLKGSRGAGHLYVVANRVRGFWEYSRLVFVPAETSKKVTRTFDFPHESRNVAGAGGAEPQEAMRLCKGLSGYHKL